MPSLPTMIYWDACIFLHFIEGTPEWMPILDAIVDDVRNDKNLIIVTSTISIVEVARVQDEKNSGVLDSKVAAAIEGLWADDETVQLIEFDQFIARRARDLLRDAVVRDRSLKPMDAIHLATAATMEVSDCHSTDTRVKAWNDLGFPVRNPWTDKPRLGL